MTKERANEEVWRGYEQKVISILAGKKEVEKGQKVFPRRDSNPGQRCERPLS